MGRTIFITITIFFAVYLDQCHGRYFGLDFEEIGKAIKESPVGQFIHDIKDMKDVNEFINNVKERFSRQPQVPYEAAEVYSQPQFGDQAYLAAERFSRQPQLPYEAAEVYSQPQFGNQPYLAAERFSRQPQLPYEASEVYSQPQFGNQPYLAAERFSRQPYVAERFVRHSELEDLPKLGYSLEDFLRRVIPNQYLVNDLMGYVSRSKPPMIID